MKEDLAEQLKLTVECQKQNDEEMKYLAAELPNSIGKLSKFRNFELISMNVSLS